MGLNFRKSFNLGKGFRLNLSKSGVGFSWGGKGYRLTRTATGQNKATVSLPGTGLSYTHVLGGKKKDKDKAETKEKQKITEESKEEKGIDEERNKKKETDRKTEKETERERERREKEAKIRELIERTTALDMFEEPEQPSDPEF